MTQNEHTPEYRVTDKWKATSEPQLLQSAELVEGRPWWADVVFILVGALATMFGVLISGALS